MPRSETPVAIIAVALWAALASAIPAAAEDFNTTAKAGRRTLVGQFATFNRRTCYAGPVPTWQIGRRPENGTLQVVSEFSSENVPGCGQHRVGFARVYYTSKPGFRGADRAAVDFIFSPNSDSPVVRNIRQNYYVTVE